MDNCQFIFADVVELVDSLDLGAVTSGKDLGRYVHEVE